MNEQQRAAFRRCEEAQRTGKTAQHARNFQTSQAILATQTGGEA